MPKQRTTDITQLGPKEAENLERATKHLKASALLVGDVELLYMGLTPSLKIPAGGIDAPDQLAFSVNITFGQLMMCRMLYTKSVIAAMRMYQADALTHLRRAIETCAFTVRMNKHRQLCKIWAAAGTDDEKSYAAYRDAFRPKDVYPKQGHPDFNPLLLILKDRFDAASKQIHGSIFGSANHFHLVPKGTNTATHRNINFFDMPSDSFPSTFFVILSTHMMILELFGQLFQPHLTDFDKWKTGYDNTRERVVRHIQQWQPTITAWNLARNTKPAKSN